MKAIDYSGGVLSYEGIELLQNVKKLAFGRDKKKIFTSLPSHRFI